MTSQKSCEKFQYNIYMYKIFNYVQKPFLNKCRNNYSLVTFHIISKLSTRAVNRMQKMLFSGYI